MFFEGKVYISRRGGLKVMIDKEGLCFSLDQERCSLLSINKNDRILIDLDEDKQKVLDFIKIE